MESAIVTCLQGNRWNHILQLCSVMVSHIDAWTLMFVSPFGPLLACVERYLLLVMQSDCLVSCSDAITGCASLSALCTEMTAARSCWSGAPELPLQTVGLQTHNRMTQSPKLEFLSASAFCYTCSDTSRIITASLNYLEVTHTLPASAYVLMLIVSCRTIICMWDWN